MFIGPPASAIEAMGSKTRARELMQAAGVPIVPGTTEAGRHDRRRAQDRREHRLPDRGQGRGRRRRQGLPRRARARQARGGLRGRGARGREVLLRRDRLPRALPARPAPRRGPGARRLHGSVIHLGERDCSIQRRHQKLIEESPAPIVDEALRERIGKIATEAARAVDYRGAGTIEGLLADGEYFFLEMNTRVQVEHCVTEATTGIDIVREQIRIAAGEPLSVTQDEVVLRGHAIECRINAEDASKNFAPAPGTVTSYREPSGPGRARRLGRARRIGDHAAVRPDGGEADRLGLRPRGRDAPDGARARGVRHRRRAHADPVPQGDHGLRAVGARRDVPRPRRGPGVAEDAGVRRARA